VEFLEGLMAEGGPKPQALQDRPVLTAHQAYFKRIFGELQDSRPPAQGGVVPIPMSEYLAYFQAFYIDSVLERELILRYVKAMDATFVRLVNKKSEEAAKEPEQDTGRMPPPAAPPRKAPSAAKTKRVVARP
jgi:hypothetical protein